MVWIHCTRIMVTMFQNGQVGFACEAPQLLSYMYLAVLVALLLGGLVGAELTLCVKYWKK